MVSSEICNSSCAWLSWDPLLLGAADHGGLREGFSPFVHQEIHTALLLKYLVVTAAGPRQ